MFRYPSIRGNTERPLPLDILTPFSYLPMNIPKQNQVYGKPLFLLLVYAMTPRDSLQTAIVRPYSPNTCDTISRRSPRKLGTVDEADPRLDRVVMSMDLRDGLLIDSRLVFLGRRGPGAGLRAPGRPRDVLFVLIPARFVSVFTVEPAAAAHGADKPRWPTGALPGPVLLEIVFSGLEIAARHEHREANQTVQHSVDKDATVQQVISKWCGVTEARA